MKCLVTDNVETISFSSNKLTHRDKQGRVNDLQTISTIYQQRMCTGSKTAPQFKRELAALIYNFSCGIDKFL